MYKILFGVPAMPLLYGIKTEDGLIRDYEIQDDLECWCDFELDFYPYNNTYKFEFETMSGFKNKDGAKNWINKCFNLLTDYMQSRGLDTTKELNLYEAFTEGYNADTFFEDIETAYAWFKMMVNGFNGEGMNSGSEE